MKEIRYGLSFRLAVIFAVFFAVAIILSGILTYRNQMAIYRVQCEDSTRRIGVNLSSIIRQEGEDFAVFQREMMKYQNRVKVPLDFDEYMTAQMDFYDDLSKSYPGRTFGVDLSYEELNEEQKQKYLVYNYEYWTLLFNQTTDDFGISCTYYLDMNEDAKQVAYLIDIERTTASEHLEGFTNNIVDDYVLGLSEEEIEEQDHYIYVCDTYNHSDPKFQPEWDAWDAEGDVQGYQIWNNEWGHTYAYYTPVIVGGRKIGLVGTEVDVETVNHSILLNSLQQVCIIGLILFLTLSALLVLIHTRYIRRLSNLDAAVREYTQDPEADVVKKFEVNNTGRDEISVLAGGLAAMVNELGEAKEETAQMEVLANMDSLTNVRNKTSYDSEIKNLQFEMESGLLDSYGIVIVDLNFLKRINDNYGHDKGNIALKKTCRIVCSVFSRSPVFRIGGDEFAVILKGEALAEKDALIQNFRDIMKDTAQNNSLEYWERVSAAIGMAVYDPEVDSSAENVFKRADADMYRNKKEMKAIRME